jgi:sec-independent protein translocase protein TatC
MDASETNQAEEQLGGQMSFLEHLDELRRRLVNSVIIILLAFFVCFYFSDRIFGFLAIPINEALGKAQRAEIKVQGVTGEEKIVPLNNLEVGQKGRFVFEKNTAFEGTRVTIGTSVDAIVAMDNQGKKGLFSDEAIFTDGAIIPKGVKLPVNFDLPKTGELKADERLIVTTAIESFTLLITVSLYAAIAFSMPFLLFQVWGFISPALYQHERKYVTPFILLSSISFIGGAAFGYYILFPPAVGYLLGLGSNFNLMLRATDYFDFITLIMLAMGIIFQMPAISYVLSRIGIISAGLLVRGWKVALIVIMIVAAVASPTPDALNMMLFATPMMFLYFISIFVAWFFGKKRTVTQSG